MHVLGLVHKCISRVAVRVSHNICRIALAWGYGCNSIQNAARAVTLPVRGHACQALDPHCGIKSTQAWCLPHEAEPTTTIDAAVHRPTVAFWA